ncbi:MAG: WD40 repeat domain-containing protein, partial [Anaerolineales bacterium]|nr:WD40 repeat domain-containing protein [Anaerolineales bacterium]
APADAAAGRARRRSRWTWGLIGLCVLLAWVAIGLRTFFRGGGEEPGAGRLPGRSGAAAAVLTADNAAEAVMRQRLGQGTIDAVALSPDGTRLAVGGTLGIWLYEAETLTPLRLLEGHEDIVRGISWAPDGTRLASAGWDETVRVWDAASGEALFVLRGDDQYNAVAWSPDGARLAAATWIPVIEVYDVESRRKVAEVAGHEDYVSALAWSPDGARLASAAADRRVIVWETAEWTPRRELPAQVGTPACVAWSPDGGRLAVCGGEAAAAGIWDVGSGELVAELVGQEYGVFDFIWLDDATALTAGGDGTVAAWERDAGWQIDVVTEYENPVVALAYVPNGARVFLVGSDGVLFSGRLDDDTEESVRVLRDHTAAFWSVAWSPDGTAVAAAGADGMMRVWDVATGEMSFLWTEHLYGVTAVAWQDGGRLATAGEDGAVFVLLPGGEVQAEWHHATSAVSSLAWHPAEPWLAMGDYEGHIWVWDADAEAMLYEWQAHEGPVTRVVWSADEERLASSGEDGKAATWDVADGSLNETELLGHEDVVADVAWSPDADYVATASFDQTVRIWDAESGEELEVLAGHRELVTAVAWSPGGELLASGGWDNRVRLWETEEWRQVAALEGHRKAAVSLAWSADGALLASAGEDGTVRVWGRP